MLESKLGPEGSQRGSGLDSSTTVAQSTSRNCGNWPSTIRHHSTSNYSKLQAKGKERQDPVMEEKELQLRNCVQATQWDCGCKGPGLDSNGQKDLMVWTVDSRYLWHQISHPVCLWHLPSPSNLCWIKVKSPSCPWCPGRRTLEHILSSSPKVLAEGRYLWCHDQVNLGKQFRLLENTMETTLRPNIVLNSEIKQVICSKPSLDVS